MGSLATCFEGVTRRGEYEPCDKPAVALRMDPEHERPYPVCKRHVRGDMVRLTEVVLDHWCTPMCENKDTVCDVRRTSRYETPTVVIEHRQPISDAELADIRARITEIRSRP